MLQTNPSLEILANPWSPPAWMKSNDSLGNANAGGSLLSQYYGAYANYFVKFIQAYAQNGIPIDAITPANEPTSGTGGTNYPGLNFPEPDEAQFIANDLALMRRLVHPDLRQRSELDQYTGYAAPLASDPNAAPDLAGIAWHCYFGSPTVMSHARDQSQFGSDRGRVLPRDPVVQHRGVPDFHPAQLGQRGGRLERGPGTERSADPTPNSCGGCRGRSRSILRPAPSPTGPSTTNSVR